MGAPAIAWISVSMSLGGRAVWKLVVFNCLIENVCNGCSIAGLAHFLVFAFYFMVFGYHENLTPFWVDTSFSEDFSLFPFRQRLNKNNKNLVFRSKNMYIWLHGKHMAPQSLCTSSHLTKKKLCIFSSLLPSPPPLSHLTLASDHDSTESRSLQKKRYQGRRDG